jgi:hypothetical protein
LILELFPGSELTKQSHVLLIDRDTVREMSH